MIVKTTFVKFRLDKYRLVMITDEPAKNEKRGKAEENGVHRQKEGISGA